MKKWTLLLPLLFILPLAAQENYKRTYTTQRLVAAPPQIDGRLDDPCWQEGVWFDDFVQYMPVEGGKPSQRTRFKILYDGHNLYAAICACDTEPGRIDRRASRRDQIDGSGDIAGLCFDSYFDHFSGFEFDISAAGTKIDVILMNGSKWDSNWNAVWDGKTAVTDSGWTAEMRIPFSQLRYDRKEEQVWGLHAWRWINRLEEENQFTLIRRNGPGHIHDMGYLRGLSGLPRSRQIEFLPYTFARLQTWPAGELSAAGAKRDWSSSGGLDGKIGIASNFTVDYTINPDFGQVEADPSELNLSAYEVFYEEKRPFFLEGQQMFDFNIGGESLFYSRRIGHAPSFTPEVGDEGEVEMPDMTTILGAAKLTGKSRDGLSIGIIEGLTQQEEARIREAGGRSRQAAVEPLSNYLVGRIIKEADEGNTIAGALITAAHRRIRTPELEFLNRGAWSGGIDFTRFLANKKYELDFKIAGSRVAGEPQALQRLQRASARYYQRPDAAHLDYDSTLTRLSGHGGELEFKKGSYGHWRYGLELAWKSPGLEFNDLGYLRATDEIDGEVSLGFVESTPGKYFSRYNLELQAERQWDFDRTHIGTNIEFDASCALNNRWRLAAGVERRQGALDNRLLRGGPALWLPGHWGFSVAAATDPGRKLQAHVEYYAHSFDDGYSAMTGFNPGLSLKITEALQLTSEFELEHEREMLHFMGAPQWQGDWRYLLAALDRKTMAMTLRLDYAISPELTIQYYGSPYISYGTYAGLRRVADPAARRIERIAPRLAPAEQDYGTAGVWGIDEDRDGHSDYSIPEPDFNFQEFRSNLVLRWEVHTGSALYLVWSHDRSGYQSLHRRDWSENWDSLLKRSGGNLFLAKFSYWFAI